jgi:hypothetical protein
MRIVNKQEFYKLPNGTLYSEYEPCVFTGLKIKKDTIFDGGNPIDFFYQDLIGNIAANSSGDFVDILDRCENDKSEFNLDFECFSQEARYKNDALYAVYNTDEILALSNKIAGCKGSEVI